MNIEEYVRGRRQHALERRWIVGTLGDDGSVVVGWIGFQTLRGALRQADQFQEDIADAMAMGEKVVVARILPGAVRQPSGWFHREDVADQIVFGRGRPMTLGDGRTTRRNPAGPPDPEHLRQWGEFTRGTRRALHKAKTGVDRPLDDPFMEESEWVGSPVVDEEFRALSKPMPRTRR